VQQAGRFRELANAHDRLSTKGLTPVKTAPSSDRLAGTGQSCVTYGRREFNRWALGPPDFQPAADPGWQIRDARFLGQVVGVSPSVGWSAGPETVQLYVSDLASPARRRGCPDTFLMLCCHPADDLQQAL